MPKTLLLACGLMTRLILISKVISDTVQRRHKVTMKRWQEIVPGLLNGANIHDLQWP